MPDTDTLTRPKASAPAKADPKPSENWPRPAWLTAVAADPAYQWAVLAWDRAAAVPGAWFDHALADGIVAEWPSWATLTEDRFAGKPFHLLPWQALIVRLLVGWQAPVEVLDPVTHQPALEQARIFRRLLLWIPRKNGKSEFLAALGLLFFAMDQVVAGQGFVFARDEEQARLVFSKMKAMAANCAELKDGTIPYKRSLWFKELRAGFEVLSGAEEGKHGKSPTVVVGDEIHEWRSREVERTLSQGTGARLQPIELYASTAGRKSNLVGMEVWEESQAILDGRVADPATLVVIFAADPDADFRDESVWPLANPSLGLSPTLGYLRRQAALAADNPRQEAHFRCYHLNQWIDAHTRWLSLKAWDACAATTDGWRLYPETLKGRKCFAAFDVSATQDITALVFIFPPCGEDPKWRIVVRFWVPQAKLAERKRDDARTPYDAWIRAGALETTPGDYVDQDYVRQALLQGVSEFDVQLIGYDPWNAAKLITDLQKNDGIDAGRLVEMRQGIHTLGEPTKHFERLVYAGQLDHGGHPVLRWMAGNAVVRFDENLNFMPAKKRSADKIDGVVAAVMAVGLALSGGEAVDLDEFIRNAVVIA